MIFELNLQLIDRDNDAHWPHYSPFGRRRGTVFRVGPPQASPLLSLTAGLRAQPNNDPDFGGEDCTIKRNGGIAWNDVPCDYTYPCYCQDVKGGGY